MKGTINLFYKHSPFGGIGRHDGLKIHSHFEVSVQVRKWVIIQIWWKW
jgi:hypothetical protein